MADTAARSTSTRLDPVLVEFGWRREGVSADQLVEVLEGLNSPGVLRDDDRMHLAERMMIAWGWSITPAYAGETFDPDNLHDRMGLWGDFCIWEEERVLWPALAPLVDPGSMIVYEPLYRNDEEDPLLRGHKWVGWRFEGGTTQLVDVEQEITYYPLADRVVWP